MELPSSPSSTNNVPYTFWNMLSAEDQAEYIALRTAFHNSSNRERHGSSIQSDLQTIRAYIDRRKEMQEIRSIVCGISFSGSFICVNTSQLKCLLGRCKSSINNGFQLLGYFSAKTKVRQCIVNVLPSLLRDSSLLRQWTIRCTESSIKVPPPQLAQLIPQRKPLPMPNINRTNGPFPTPIINSSPNQSPPSNKISSPIIPSSLPKTSSMLDGASPPNAAFFDLPSEIGNSDLNAFPAAPRPVSMPNLMPFPYSFETTPEFQEAPEFPSFRNEIDNQSSMMEWDHGIMEFDDLTI